MTNQTLNNQSDDKGKYRHLFVVIETINNDLIPASLEMLGEARRLMDKFNLQYNSDEKVIAIILGDGIRNLSQELIFYGADAVIYADNPHLKYAINKIHTKIISKIVTDSNFIGELFTHYGADFIKPRYMFFLADNIGRHLSATY